MRCRAWFAAGVLAVPVIVLAAEKVTGRTLELWWAWRSRA